MSGFTRQIIKETFIRLLEEKPYSEITVKELVEKCGINRNTFYYHFQDLPALIEEIVRESADSLVRKYPTLHSFLECYDAIVNYASEHRRAIMHICCSANREMFEKHLMDTCRYFISIYADAVFTSGDAEIDLPTKNAIIDYYKCACFGFFIDCLNNDMEEDRTKTVRSLLFARRERMIEIARMLQLSQE